ncbi:MAG: carboxypeptidase regulatory-like domain-containing protein [Pseudomonadota bacterium]
MASKRKVIDLLSGWTLTLGLLVSGLAHAGTIAGSVESDSMSPITIGSVFIYDDMGFIVDEPFLDGIGEYVSVDLPDGTYYAATRNAEGFIDEYYDNEVCNVDCFLVATTGTPIIISGGNVTGIDFALTPGSRVSGTVTDESMNPLVGVQVCVIFDTEPFDPTPACGFTDAMGDYITEGGLPDGDYSAFANPDPMTGFEGEFFGGDPLASMNPDPTGFTVSGGDVTDIDFELGMGGGGMPAGSIQVDVERASDMAIVDGGEFFLFDDSGEEIASFFIDRPMDGGLIDDVEPGDYFGVFEPNRTENPNLIAQYFDGIDCDLCDDPIGAGATPFTVNDGNTTTVDFSLAAGFTVSGNVTDGGGPLEGMEVCLADSMGNPQQLCGLTDAGGDYTTAPAAAGTYFAVAFDPNDSFVGEVFPEVRFDGTNATDGTPIVLGPDQTGIDFTLDPGGRIVGTVLDGMASPLPDLEVQIFDAAGNPFAFGGPTETPGMYATEPVPNGDYYVYARPIGGDEFIVPELHDNVPCPDLRGCDVLLDGVTIAVSQGSDTVRDFTLERGGKITGTVLDDMAGPLDARIIFFDAAGNRVTAVKTEPGDGTFSAVLPVGSYFVGTENQDALADELFDGAAGFPCTVAGCSGDAPANGLAVNVTEGVTVGNVDFDLAPGGPVNFTVSGNVDAMVDVPQKMLASIDVCLLNTMGGETGLCGVTDAAGDYLIEFVPPGDYLVRAVDPTEVRAAQLAGGFNCATPTLCDFGIPPLTVTANVTGVDFLLPRTGTIEGQVLDAEGAPVGGATIRVFVFGGPQAFDTTTALDGTYATGPLGPRDYQVVVEGAGFPSELFDDVTCADDCSAELGTQGATVSVGAGFPTGSIDFAVARESTVVTPPLDDNSELGTSIAVCGQRMFVGVPGGENMGGLVSGVVQVYVLQGGEYVFEQTIEPSGGTTGDRFGFALACTLDFLAVTVPGNGGGGAAGKGRSQKGSVLMFNLTGGAAAEVQSLVAGNLGTGQTTEQAGFGTSVAMSGASMVVGAPATEGGGAAVVYRLDPAASTWGEETTLSDPDGQDGDDFGAAVDVDGGSGVIMVGAPNQEDDSGITTGLAQLFENAAGTSDWTNVGKFTNADAQEGDQFGASVSINGSTLVVGAPGDDSAGENAGAASIFTFDGNNTTFVTELVADDGQAGDGFGTAVDLDFPRVLLGSPNADGAEPDSGVAYLFEFDGTWLQTQQLPGAEGGDGFGSAVSLTETGVVVGAPGASAGGTNRGSITAIVPGEVVFRSSFERE